MRFSSRTVAEASGSTPTRRASCSASANGRQRQCSGSAFSRSPVGRAIAGTGRVMRGSWRPSTAPWAASSEPSGLAAEICLVAAESGYVVIEAGARVELARICSATGRTARARQNVGRARALLRQAPKTGGCWAASLDSPLRSRVPPGLERRSSAPVRGGTGDRAAVRDPVVRGRRVGRVGPCSGSVGRAVGMPLPNWMPPTTYMFAAAGDLPGKSAWLTCVQRCRSATRTSQGCHALSCRGTRQLTDALPECFACIDVGAEVNASHDARLTRLGR